MQTKNALRDYGLSENQAKVYLACLETGGGTVQKISAAADLPRTTCYQILEALKPLGLVSTLYKKKILHFNPTDPKEIVSDMQKRVDRLKETVPLLQSMYNKHNSKPKMRCYEGRKGVNLIFSEVLEEAEELFSISSTDDIATLMGKDFDSFIKKRIANKIPVRVIMRDSLRARHLKEIGSEQLRVVRILPPSFEHHSLVFIWKNKVAMFSYEKDFAVFIIESKELAQLHKSTFEYMWNSLE